jgi:flagellin
MALTINTNVASLEAQKNLSRTQSQLQGSFAKLSSGLRVNSAADDAAGLAISESMKAQIRSYTVAQRNAGDGISMAQTAEGALGQIHDILGRMRELAMEASNGSLTTTDRGNVTTEFGKLQEEITRIQGSTKFNGQDLIGGSATTVSFQVGLGTDENDTIDVGFSAVVVSDATGAAVDTAANAQAALDSIDTTIANVSTARATLGSAVNRLQYASANIQTMSLNLSAANSRIVDVDVAAETASMSRAQVLAQAGIAVLAQANQLPQLAYGLIGK